MSFALDQGDRTTVLVHYYRAMATRADIWRTRMDATTNWAIGSSAAVLSFVLGDPDAPASALGIATVLTFVFLLLEARRLTFYHLWQRRVLLLERFLVRPALGGAPASSEEAEAAQRELLDQHLGRTVPSMPMRKAIARRFRRVYLFLFAVQGLALGLKLSQPSTQPGGSGGPLARIVEAAGLPGWALGAISVGIGLAAAALWSLGGVDRRKRD